MSATLVIPEERIWVTPGGYKHVQYYRCELCHDLRYARPTTTEETCKLTFPDAINKWNTQYRPPANDYINGHYYVSVFLTLEFDKSHEGVTIEMPKPKATQQRLF